MALRTRPLKSPPLLSQIGWNFNEPFLLSLKANGAFHWRSRLVVTWEGFFNCLSGRLVRCQYWKLAATFQHILFSHFIHWNLNIWADSRQNKRKGRGREASTSRFKLQCLFRVWKIHLELTEPWMIQQIQFASCLQRPQNLPPLSLSSRCILDSPPPTTICCRCAETKELENIREVSSFFFLFRFFFFFHRTCHASSKTHLPLETHAKLVKRDGKPWKESAGFAPCQQCTQCESIFLSLPLSQRQLDQQALWIFNQKRLEKLSATRHHLFWPCWLCFLSSAAMPDKPSEGPPACPAACGNWRAELQKDAGGQTRFKSREVSEEAADLELHFHSAAEQCWQAIY